LNCFAMKPHEVKELQGLPYNETLRYINTKFKEVWGVVRSVADKSRAFQRYFCDFVEALDSDAGLKPFAWNSTEAEQDYGNSPGSLMFLFLSAPDVYDQDNTLGLKFETPFLTILKEATRDAGRPISKETEVAFLHVSASERRKSGKGKDNRRTNVWEGLLELFFLAILYLMYEALTGNPYTPDPKNTEQYMQPAHSITKEDFPGLFEKATQPQREKLESSSGFKALRDYRFFVLKGWLNTLNLCCRSKLPYASAGDYERRISRLLLLVALWRKAESVASLNDPNYAFEKDWNNTVILLPSWQQGGLVNPNEPCAVSEGLTTSHWALDLMCIFMTHTEDDPT